MTKFTGEEFRFAHIGPDDAPPARCHANSVTHQRRSSIRNTEWRTKTSWITCQEPHSTGRGGVELGRFTEGDVVADPRVAITVQDGGVNQAVMPHHPAGT